MGFIKMKKILNILTIIALIITINYDSYSQLFETQGNVVNEGTIKVKNRQLKQTGGRIENDSGQIIIDAPTTVFAQDTLSLIHI